MRKLFCFAGIVLLILGASWLTLDPVQAQTKALEPVKIGYSGIGIAHDLMKIMEKNRIFEKDGLNAQAIYIGSGSLMNQAIVGGSIQFTTSDLPSQIQAALAGIDFKIISVTINRLDGALMARKEIRKPEDLKGRRLAISRFGSVSISTLSWCCAIGNSIPKKTWRSCRWATRQPDRGDIQRAGGWRADQSDGYRQSHSFGLLRSARRPGRSRHSLRAVWRHRDGQLLEIAPGHRAQVDGSLRRWHPLLQNSRR